MPPQPRREPRKQSRAAVRPHSKARRAAPPALARVGTTAADGADETRCIDQAKVGRARRVMPMDRTIERAAEVLRALGDPTRLRIARALAAEELCVCDIAYLLGLSQPTVSHSLRALRQLRLVRHRRDGKIAYYALDDVHVVQVLDSGLAHAAKVDPGS